jgi:hypothetical protein
MHDIKKSEEPAINKDTAGISPSGNLEFHSSVAERGECQIQQGYPSWIGM